MSEKSNPVINRIADPSPSVLTQLDQINRQVNLYTGNLISEPPLGTLTATKRNSSTKLFIVGFIPPSPPVNFIPIENIPSIESLRAGLGELETVGGQEAVGEEAQAEVAADVGAMTLSEEELANSYQNKAIMAYSGTTRLESQDPNTTRLKKNIRAADDLRQRDAKKQTDALRAQIQAINNTPPLALAINPQSFDRSYEQAVDSPKGRVGHIVHSWLERPMKISSSGVSAGQYVLDGVGGGGLTAERRVHTISYQNLMSLVLMYKNNGVIFAGIEAGSERGIPIVACSLYIYYDNHIYIGSFDDFGIDDRANKPFNMGYSFKFNVRYDLDIDSSHLVESSVFGVQTSDQARAQTLSRVGEAAKATF
jgi:hypothetical protein